MMKLSICSSDYKYYNANSRDKNVGDCVKRSISLAFNVPYNQVTKDLAEIRNELNKQYGYEAYRYNNYKVYSNLIYQYGGSGRKKVRDLLDYTVTVGQFADMIDGTVLVECGPSPSTVNHIVCIIDGTIYDSWNSTEDIAIYYYTVGSVSRYEGDVIQNESGIADELNDYVEEELNLRAPNLTVEGISFECDLYTTKSRDNITFTFEFDFDTSYLEKIPLTVVCKFSPFDSSDEFIQKAKKTLSSKIYHFINSMKKEIIDINKLYKGRNPYPNWKDNEYIPLGGLNKRVYDSLPSWVKPLLDFMEIKHQSYLLALHPLPGDPVNKDYYIDCENRKELNYILDRYKKTYERDGYDYYVEDEI